MLPFSNTVSQKPTTMAVKSLFLLCILSALIQLTLAADLQFHWEVGYLSWSPDCHDNVVIGINGTFPGPTIQASAGDTIHVHVTNKLGTEGVVIHWHGIRQFETPWADGTASISQCPINPEETFEYNFKVDKPGTYFYHGHFGMQRSAGLYGSLIVDVGEGKQEPFHYDKELSPMLLSDWWHQSVIDQASDLSSQNFQWIGEPQSLLINGRGQYNCSLAAIISNSSLPFCPEKMNEQCSPDIFNVQPNTTYRLRITSTTSLSALNVAIQNHTMTVVEADGNYIENVTVDSIDIYSGESYSVLIKTHPNTSANYWVAVSVIGRNSSTPQGLTLFSYDSSNSSKLPTSPPPPSPIWNDTSHSKAFLNNTRALHNITNSTKPPSNYNRRIILLNTQNKVNNYTRWAINNISLVFPATPYLAAIKYNLTEAFDQTIPPDNYSSNYDVMTPPENKNAIQSSSIYTLDFNSTVDVILQNANATLGGNSEIHPWHLHGHDFWVLGYGEGKFTDADEGKLNTDNPPLKNTVVLFPFGWTALRFVTDNPGVWAFHCHIEPHLHMGMGVIFAEGVDHIKNMTIPTTTMGCGETKKLINGTAVQTSNINALSGFASRPETSGNIAMFVFSFLSCFMVLFM